jgi:hypothetical protein
MTRTIVCLVFVAALLPAGLHGQAYAPAPANLENREWFQDAKFGLFVHWGVYSVLGVEEWVMEKQQIDKATYERVASFFNPVAFDAEEWVLTAKDAGMQYITITAKHHDGFAMFDSQHTDWDIVDRTVYGKDVLALQDKAYKSPEELIRYLVRAAGYNSNFLLNVGPIPNGKIQPEFVATLGAMGDWTDVYGDSIYGTRGGPIPPQSWGVTTHKDDRVFVHVLDWQQDSLLIPALDRPIEQVRSFPDGTALDWETTEFGTLLRLPAGAEGPDRVIEITWARER